MLPCTLYVLLGLFSDDYTKFSQCNCNSEEDCWSSSSYINSIHWYKGYMGAPRRRPPSVRVLWTLSLIGKWCVSDICNRLGSLHLQFAILTKKNHICHLLFVWNLHGHLFCLQFGNHKACFNDYNNPLKGGAGYILSWVS